METKEAVKEETKHTPTPYIQLSDCIYAAGKNGGTICAVSQPRATSTVEYTRVKFGCEDFHEAIANAEFIVKACNSHDELVSTLKDIIADFEDRGVTEASINKAREALKAEKGIEQ